MIKLTNTLGMQKELLVPVKESKIGMPFCGAAALSMTFAIWGTPEPLSLLI